MLLEVARTFGGGCRMQVLWLMLVLHSRPAERLASNQLRIILALLLCRALDGTWLHCHPLRFIVAQPLSDVLHLMQVARVSFIQLLEERQHFTNWPSPLELHHTTFQKRLLMLLVQWCSPCWIQLDATHLFARENRMQLPTRSQDWHSLPPCALYSILYF